MTIIYCIYILYYNPISYKHNNIHEYFLKKYAIEKNILNET